MSLKAMLEYQHDYPKDIFETGEPYVSVHPYLDTREPALFPGASTADRPANCLSDQAIEEFHLELVNKNIIQPRQLPTPNGMVVKTWESRLQAFKRNKEGEKTPAQSQFNVPRSSRIAEELAQKFPLHDRLNYQKPPDKLNLAHFYYRYALFILVL